MASSTSVKTAGKPRKSAPYPFWLGGAAASFAAVCTHPLDLAKVRMQTSKSKGMLSTLRISVQQDGFRRGAYAGLSASIMRQMTYSLTRFGVYDALKARLAVPGDTRPLPAWKMALAASIAGGLGGIAGNPADVILVRMTSDANKPIEKQLKYRHAFDGVARIVRDEGAVSLFRGAGPNVARAVLMNASQLATYDVFKSGLLRMDLMKDGLALHFTSSFLAGTVATTICAPFDVIKSRIMNAAGNESVVQVIQKSFRREGIKWMFRGWTPAWIRLSPNTIIIFMTLEQLKRGVDWLRA